MRIVYPNRRRRCIPNECDLGDVATQLDVTKPHTLVAIRERQRMITKNKSAIERVPSAWMWTLCIAIGVYVHSSIHRLAGGDSGELLAEACVGGVAHPPGYPLLLLALRAARWIGSYALPDEPFAILANCLNAIFAAGAAACVTHVVALLMGGEAPVEAVVAGLLYAFSALTWEYALGLEVFALNNLLVGLLLVCFVRHFVLPHSIKNLCVGALLCGLGLANQHTIVLFEIPLILWILASSSLSLLIWLGLTTSFILGLCPYIYTFVASQTPTTGSWGDTSSLHGLWTHIFRREYGTFQLSPLQSPSDNFVSRLSFYFEDLVSEFTIGGSMLALVGIFSGPLVVFSNSRVAVAVKAKSKSPKPTATTSSLSPPPVTVACALLVAFTFYVVVFNALANLPLGEPLTREITRRFFMQPNMIVAICIGLGLSFLHNHMRIPGAARLVTLGSLALAAHQYHRNHHAFTESSIAQHDLVRGFGSSILESLPRNAILLSYTDIQWNSVRYLQQCERKRTDVVHLNLQIMAFPWFQRQRKRYPTIKFPANLPDVSTNRSSQGYASYLSRFVLANLHPQEKKKQKRSIFLDLHGVDEAMIAGEQLLFGHLQVLPHGLVWQITQSTAAAANENNAKLLRRSWQQYAEHRPEGRPEDADLLMRCCGLFTSGAAPPADIQRGSWEFVVVSIAHDAMYQRGLTRLGYWLTHGSQIKTVAQLEEAVVAYGDIQHELNELVWAGVKTIGGAISYDLYAVEKNAVVSRQRFQLYLEALADLLDSTAANAVKLSPQAKSYVEKCRVSRREIISQLSGFLDAMEAQHDEDSQTLRNAMETLQQKEQGGKAPSRPNAGKKKTRKKSKKNRT